MFKGIARVSSVLAIAVLLLMQCTPVVAAGIQEVAQMVRSAYSSHSEQMLIHAVELTTQNPATYKKLELHFQLDANYNNPFDPDDIKVDAEITLPSGRVATVPAFYQMPYRSMNGQTWLQGYVNYERIGQPQWVVRYTPTEPGTHKVRLVAVKPHPGGQTEQTQTEPLSITVAAAPSLGFVTSSTRNQLYFENSGDGSLFYPVGANIAWTRSGDANLGRPDGSMEYYFRKAAGNMTATRVWMCHYAWLEWMPLENQPATSSWNGYGGLNFYNQMVASAFDRVFEMAEQQGLRIMLTLDDNDEHDTATTAAHGWKYNPYNAANGGPCSEPSCVYSNPEARRAYQNRLRYIIARWGYSTSLWAINTWNDYSAPNTAQTNWVAEMRDYVHSLTDGIRPMFFGTNFRFAAQAVSDYAQAESGSLIPGKPNVIQEVYFTSDNNWFLPTLQYELWSNLARGRGGVMVWPHHIIDKLNAWSPVFRNIAEFVQDIPLSQKEFHPVQARVTAIKAADSAASDLVASAIVKVVSLSSYGDVPDWGVKAPRDTWDIDARASNQFLEGYGVKLYGQRADRVAWRTTPTFNIDLPAPGKLMVRIYEVSGTAQVRARNHGQIVVDKTFKGSGRWYPKGEDEYLVVPLPAGPNSVQLSLDGSGDWVSLDQIYFTYEVPDATNTLDVFGLTSGEEAFLYIWNPTYGEVYQKVMHGLPQRFTDVQLEVSGLQDGNYRVALYNTTDGSVTAVQQAMAQGGKLHFTLPEIENEVAVKIMGNQ